MISVIIDAHEERTGLISLLAALIPAAADGVVRDVLVLGSPADREAEFLAEETGAEFVPVEAEAEGLAQATRRAKSSWLLLLKPTAVPEPGFEDHVADFVARCSGQGDTRRAAVFGGHAGAERSSLLTAIVAFLRDALSPLARARTGLLLHRDMVEEVARGISGKTFSPAAIAQRIGGDRIEVLRGARLRLAQAARPAW